jgi:hypothetical protein
VARAFDFIWLPSETIILLTGKTAVTEEPGFKFQVYLITA